MRVTLDKCKLIFKGLLFLLAFSCFFFQIWSNFNKFLAGKTSFDQSQIRKESNEPLPTFSICSEPAFNENYLENELNVTGSLFYSTSMLSNLGGKNAFPDLTYNDSVYSENSLEYFWNKTILAPRYFAVNNDMVYDDTMVKKSNKSEIRAFEIINSFYYGKCTSVVLERPRKDHELLIIIFGLLSR